MSDQTTPERFEQKPQGASQMFIRFRCKCGRENEVSEYFAEWTDLGDGDSLNFTCQCGAYYKKMGRIPDVAIIERWYEAEVANG